MSTLPPEQTIVRRPRHASSSSPIQRNLPGDLGLFQHASERGKNRSPSKLGWTGAGVERIIQKSDRD